MKFKGTSIVKVVLVLVLLAGIVFLGINMWENHRSSREYDEAKQLAEIPRTVPAAVPETEAETETETETAEETPVEALKNVNLAVLQDVNEEVIGWIQIPDTQISYPLVQGADNDFYLTHTWKKAENSGGAIFMECQNAADFGDFNTIIYGHNRRNQALFGSLSKYKEAEYWKSHPSIYIVSDGGVYQYDIFAVHEAGVRTIVYGMDIESEEVRDEFIQYALEHSVIDTGVIPEKDDRILTLSTCTDYGYATRWVIQAVLNEEASFFKDEEEYIDSVEMEDAALEAEMIMISEGTAAVPLAEAAPGTQPAAAPAGQEAAPAVQMTAAQMVAVLSAQPSGVLQAGGNHALIDYSNTRDGYVMVQYSQPSAKRLKVQVKGPTTTYTYNLSPQQWNVFPLSDGNGAYQVSVFQNVMDNRYAQLLSTGFSVELADEFAPFIRANQYVNYSAASAVVAVAEELTKDIADPLQKVERVYEYVVTNLRYDKEKAAAVTSGYLPVLDLVLAEKKGICFDYAALMTGMLRSQGIPCKLVVGYAGTAYHAWISVWTEETGWVDGVIYFDSKKWHRMDPTFASSGQRSDSIMQYIGNGANYTTKYLY